MSVAAANAVIDVMREDDLVGNAKRMGEVLRGHHERMAERHPSVGLHRNLGLFGCLELVRDRDTMEPLSPFNSMNDVMGQINRYLLDNGVYTMIRWHIVMTNPPLCITEEQLGEAFDVMDKALEIADQAMGA
jgi:taurine---2-oxoglutarate transaminase